MLYGEVGREGVGVHRPQCTTACRHGLKDAGDIYCSYCNL